MAAKTAREVVGGFNRLVASTQRANRSCILDAIAGIADLLASSLEKRKRLVILSDMIEDSPRVGNFEKPRIRPQDVRPLVERAKAAAGTRDIRIGGGVSTIRQYIEAKLLDEMHVPVSPVLLGAGEHLFGGLDLPALGYRCTATVPGPRAVHYTISRSD